MADDTTLKLDAAGIATQLSSGHPVIYIWDNAATSSHYEIVFTPLYGVRIASSLDAPTRTTTPDMILVSLPDWGCCYVFNLFAPFEQYFHPDYVAEKMSGMSTRDAEVVADLLTMVHKDILFQQFPGFKEPPTAAQLDEREHNIDAKRKSAGPVVSSEHHSVTSTADPSEVPIFPPDEGAM